MDKKIKVIFVCLGNICRSPLAEAIMVDTLSKRNLSDLFEVDSAGTSHFHIGWPPDGRSVKVAFDHGITLEHVARQFDKDDYKYFDYILAMDHINYEDILSKSRNKADRAKVFLLRSFDKQTTNDYNVSDPYYGMEHDFEEIWKIFQNSIDGFLGFLENQGVLTLPQD